MIAAGDRHLHAKALEAVTADDGLIIRPSPRMPGSRYRIPTLLVSRLRGNERSAVQYNGVPGTNASNAAQNCER